MREPRQFRLQGWHVLVILMGFFGVVGGVNAVMLRLAISTMPGLDARNGYDVSQRYNGEIARAHALDERGLKVEAALARAGQGATLHVNLRDRDSAAVSGAEVSARLEHPALRARDLAVALDDAGEGRYVANLRDVHSGGWTLVIEVKNAADGKLLFLSRNRVTLGGA